MKTDNPAQYFFNFKASEGSKEAKIGPELHQLLRSPRLPGTVKVVAQPLWINKILLRFENVADSGEKEIINLNEFARNIMLYANMKHVNLHAQFEELSLSSMMPLKEMLERKVHCTTVADDKNEFIKSKIDYTIKDGMFTLEPQRIRVFAVWYEKPNTDEEKFLI